MGVRQVRRPGVLLEWREEGGERVREREREREEAEAEAEAVSYCVVSII